MDDYLNNLINQLITSIKTPESAPSLVPAEKAKATDKPIGIIGDVAGTARLFVKNYPNLKASCCWDWVHQVYEAAGCSFSRVYQDLNYTGKDCGNHHANQSLLSSLKPGDWIYCNNKNKLDSKGNHSLIFLGWRGANNAEVASYFDNRSHIHIYNVIKFPVVHISKPVLKSSKKAISSNLNEKVCKLADLYYQLSIR